MALLTQKGMHQPKPPFQPGPQARFTSVVHRATKQFISCPLNKARDSSYIIHYNNAKIIKLLEWFGNCQAQKCTKLMGQIGFFIDNYITHCWYKTLTKASLIVNLMTEKSLILRPQRINRHHIGKLLHVDFCYFKSVHKSLCTPCMFLLQDCIFADVARNSLCVSRPCVTLLN